MKRFNFLLTGILVVLLASCSQRTQITDSKPTVKIDTVLSAGGQTALQFPGRVKAAQDISLSFRVSGTILRMYVNDGTYVRKGQRNWTLLIIRFSWMLRKRSIKV